MAAVSQILATDLRFRADSRGEPSPNTRPLRPAPPRRRQRLATNRAAPRIFLFLLLAAVAVPAMAVEDIGQRLRDSRTLSSAEVEGLLAGAGMGFAKAAELNGYPGPAHVLELARQLDLSEAQLAATSAIHARMQDEAQAAGAALVAAEHELETLFRSRAATPARLSDTLARISGFQTKVREAHLSAHIEQTRLLTADQIARYARLRGDSREEGGSDPQHGHQHSPARHSGH